MLNQHYIAIKVDREERPDVDELYMRALVAMTGHGGWPMSVFLLPDGTPFFAASTIQHDPFIQLLDQIQAKWTEDPKAFQAQHATLKDKLAHFWIESSPKTPISDSIMTQFIEENLANYDPIHHGFGNAPKFPAPHDFRTLFQSQNPKAQDISLKSLDAILKGGIYDHVGGGFHRYSVDAEWNIPHFEKMLYDQAGMLNALLDAVQITQNPAYKQAIRQTLDWLLEEMQAPDGGFYAALDAGDYQKEGEFYAWSKQEIQDILSEDDYRQFSAIYTLIPIEEQKPQETAIRIQNHLDLNAIPDTLAPLLGKLKAIRNQRPKPHRDEKIITAWNGMIIESFARAGRILNEPKYLETAQNTANFILDHLYQNQHLHRYWKNGKAHGYGSLNDYASFIAALLTLYQSDFNPKWHHSLVNLQNTQNTRFLDAENGGYFTDSGQDSTLISRSKDYSDMAMASGNSISAHNLLILSHLEPESGYQTQFDALIQSIGESANQRPSQFAALMRAIDKAEHGMKELVIAASETKQEADLASLSQEYHPYSLLASGGEPPHPIIGHNKGMKDDKATYYLCEKGLCQAPTDTLPLLN